MNKPKKRPNIYDLEGELASQLKERPKLKLARTEKETPRKEEVKAPPVMESREDIKEKKRPLSPYFYRVQNHHELFKIGSSFFNDFMSGVKSFAISSTGYQSSQQRSILGIASYFDHQEDVKIGIVSDNLYLGAFRDIVKSSTKIDLNFSTLETGFEVSTFYNHFDFIDLNNIIALGSQLDSDYEDFLDELMDMYDVIFWDVPELYKLQAEKEIFFPIVMKFESLSIIVAKSNSHTEEVADIKSFFLGYGINLKGLLLDSKKEASGDDGEGKKQPWWKRFWR